MKYLNLKTLLAVVLSTSSFLRAGWNSYNPNTQYGWENQACYFYDPSRASAWASPFGFIQTPILFSDPSEHLQQSSGCTLSKKKKKKIKKPSDNVDQNAIQKRVNFLPGSGSTSAAGPQSPMYVKLDTAADDFELDTKVEPKSREETKKRSAKFYRKGNDGVKEVLRAISMRFDTLGMDQEINSDKSREVLREIGLDGAKVFSLDVLPHVIGDIIEAIRFVNLKGKDLEPRYFISYLSKSVQTYPHFGINVSGEGEEMFVTFGSIVTTLDLIPPEISRDRATRRRVYSIASSNFQDIEYKKAFGLMDTQSHALQKPAFSETYLVKRDDDTICLSKNTISSNEFRLVLGKINLAESGEADFSNISPEGNDILCDQIELAFKRPDLSEDYSSGLFPVPVFADKKGAWIRWPKKCKNRTIPVKMLLEVRDGKLYLGRQEHVERALGRYSNCDLSKVI